MCAQCQAEYDDPYNRRFHAQPNACPACGPRLSLLDADGQPIACADPLAATVARLIRGDVLAIKGLGGYHLVCDALNAHAVARLRQRKQREARPFALMLPDLATVRAYTELSAAEESLLTSIQRPIVLLTQKPPATQPRPLAPRRCARLCHARRDVALHPPCTRSCWRRIKRPCHRATHLCW